MDYSKWKNIGDDEDLPSTKPVYAPDAEAEALIQSSYASEMAKEIGQVDRLSELKIKLAVDAYERRRPVDKFMHHYWIKEAGDPEAVGKYYQSGDPSDMWADAPIYRNQHGVLLHRDKAPTGPNSYEESFVWVIGKMEDRRILYMARTDDLSAPTLGWEARTAPEPLPIVRYYTETSAARVFKESGNAAFHKKDWAEAEDCYTKALACKMDAAESAEPLGMLHSNRAEVRLQLCNFTGALADAESAYRYLQTVVAKEEATKTLKLKTVVRLAKARQALKSYQEALSLLQAEKRNFPDNGEIDHLIEEIKVSQGSGKQSSGGATPEMLKFLRDTLGMLQQEVDGLGKKLSDAALPSSCATSLKKLEYVMFRASKVQGECLSDLQTVMRANDGLRVLQQVSLAQWNANLDGKVVDVFQLPAAASVATIVGLSCISCPENLKIASSMAHYYFSMLGGCSKKVDKDTCEVLISLASGLMAHSKVKTLELIQAHSSVVERATSFLSKALLADPSDDGIGFDCPPLASEAKEQAKTLLVELLAAGGRVEKRALRGAVPQLAGPQGGFFTADSAPIREIGESVASKALADPSLMSSIEVRNFLVGADLLICSGVTADAKDVTTISYEEFGPEAKMRYVDLQGFKSTAEGKYCALLLKAVSKALEFRLLRNGEVEKDSYESAFHEGGGYYVVVPLLQGPADFAEPALLCLATLAQTSVANITTLAGLAVYDILIGMPHPVEKPMASALEETLKASAAARKSAAKLLAKTVETQAKNSQFKLASSRLIKLAQLIDKDGLSSIESFDDVLQVFCVILETRPGPLITLMSSADELLWVLVDFARRTDETDVTKNARSIITLLWKDKACKKKLKNMTEIAEGIRTYEPEDDLLSSTPWFHPFPAGK